MFKKPRLNITAKLVGYLLVAGVVPMLLFGMAAFQIAREIVITQAGEYNQRLMSDTSIYLRLYRNQVEDLAANIVGNEAIARALRDADIGAASSYESLNTKAQIGYILNGFVRVKGLVSLDLFSLKGAHFHVGETLNVSGVQPEAVQRMIREASASNNAALWRGIEDNINSASLQKKVITVTRLIKYFSPEAGTTANVGLLIINLNDDIMREYFSAETTQARLRLMLIDQQGRIMYHPNRALLGMPMSPELLQRVRGENTTNQLQLDNQEVILTTRPLPEINSQLILATPLEMHTAPVNRLATAGAFLLLFGLIGIGVLAHFFARTVVTPLRAVSQRFQELKDNPDASPPPLPVPEKHDEIASLIQGFNGYLANLKFQRTVASELQRSEQSLLESAHTLHTAIDTIDEAFVVFDEKDHLVICNEKYRDLYQVCSKVLVPGSTFEEIMRASIEHGLYPVDASRTEEWLEKHLASHANGTTDIEQKLGDERWLRVVERKTPTNHIVGFHMDISHLKNIQQAAEAANQAKSQFLATMSHEIRTPLNGILGMAQMLMMPGINDEERLDYARVIVDSGQTLLTLLNDILDLSKIEAGRIELEARSFEPNEIVSETLSLFAGSAQAKGLALGGIWKGVSGQRFEADTQRIRQMLSNLVGNAIKFTEQGTISIEVLQVSANEEQAVLEFAVVDSGIGLSPKILTTLFSPFLQADSSITRKYGGTGLGLSIVRSLAKLMGGEAGVESEQGKGSRFWFRVSVKRLLPGSDTQQASSRAGNRTYLPTFAGRILVIEDNATNQLVVTTLLNKLGLATQDAPDGQQGLDAIQRGEVFDLVLMDLHMPVMDGYETTKRIRAWENTEGKKRTPIIALTAYAFAEDKTRCLRAGMDDYLTKPLQVNALVRALEHNLQNASQQADIKENIPVDAERIGSIMSKLLPMLADNRLDAMDVFKELQGATTGTRLSGEVSKIAPLLMQLKFAEVAEQLRRMADSEDMEIVKQ